MSTPALTPKAFDQVTAPPVPKREKLWGAPAIAQHLGVSEETVRNWAREPSIPIFSPRRGSYFAYRSELDRWLRQKPAA